jgi:hypothetical protein
MKLAVFSDSHDNLDALNRALDMLRELRPDLPAGSAEGSGLRESEIGVIINAL